MKNIFYILTGGRPMCKLAREGFWDKLAQRKVNHYVDKFGRKWMAFSKWSLFRVEVKSNG
jgi:hypothetical protein